MFVVVALIVIIGAFVAWSYALFRSDRHRAANRGQWMPPSVGAPEGVVPVAVAVSAGSEVPVATRAIENLGGSGIRVLHGKYVVGWLGDPVPFGRIPLQSARQGYELCVLCDGRENGVAELRCCARPRSAMALVGGGASDDLARQLASEVVRLAAGT